MSSPSTKRDQRREARKSQIQQRQVERRQARQRALRIQATKRYGLIGGVVLAVVLLGLLVAHFAFSGSPRPTTFALPAPHASGSPIDGIQCLGSEQITQHIHANLEVYVNGVQGVVPAGIGIVPGKCLYFTHTHQATGMIHIESPDKSAVYTLGNVFDIWGQPLTGSRLFGYTVDSSHKLTVVLYDANGTRTTYSGNPASIPLGNHETIILLYNTPNVHTSAFQLPAGIPDWGDL